jgi:ribosomal protein S27E
MIKRKDDTWSTIQCQNCGNCHKVLKDIHMRALLCPYCGTTITLSEGIACKTRATQGIQKAAGPRFAGPVTHLENLGRAWENRREDQWKKS